jgi:hypothetical protein
MTPWRGLAAGALLSLACSSSVSPPSGCPFAGGLTVAADRTFTTSCVVNGNLIVAGGAHLLIDYSGASSATFVVTGNVLTQDSATLEVRGPGAASGAAFIVTNQYNDQLTITCVGRSTFELEGIALQTRAPGSAPDGSRSMHLIAQDEAVVVVSQAQLDPETSWLLADFHDQSQLQATNTVFVPTEIYGHDSSQVVISGSGTQTGVWFESPPSGTVNLPVQGAPYTWQMGKSAGFAVGWQLTITDAQVGLGLSSLPGSQLTINGHGVPATGEFKVGYMLAGGQDTLRDLAVGLQNGVIGNGRITFNNVNLGPVAWQIYVGTGENLFIDSSVVNEIGFSGQAAVTVDHSILQFGVLGALAPGSILTVSNSDIWNQLIEADNTGAIQINNSRVVGSLLDAQAPASTIQITGGSFADNPSGCTPAMMVDLTTGQPLCNPYRPAGSPQRTGSGTVSCSGTTGCSF